MHICMHYEYAMCEHYYDYGMPVCMHVCMHVCTQKVIEAQGAHAALAALAQSCERCQAVAPRKARVAPPVTEVGEKVRKFYEHNMCINVYNNNTRQPRWPLSGPGVQGIQKSCTSGHQLVELAAVRAIRLSVFLFKVVSTF